MNATLNAYKNGQPVKIEARRFPEERVLSFALITDDGQILLVDCEASELFPDDWGARGEYRCSAVYVNRAYYRDGEEVYFSEEDDAAFEDLARDFLNARDGQIDEYYRITSNTSQYGTENLYTGRY